MVGYHDSECIELFREGCSIVGDLPCSGNGRPLNDEAASLPDIEALVSARVANNRALVQKLKEDEHSHELLKMAGEDALKHRMSAPRILGEEDMTKYTLSPRFCIEQGMCKFTC